MTDEKEYLPIKVNDLTFNEINRLNNEFWAEIHEDFPAPKGYLRHLESENENATLKIELVDVKEREADRKIKLSENQKERAKKPRKPRNALSALVKEIVQKKKNPDLSRNELLAELDNYKVIRDVINDITADYISFMDKGKLKNIPLNYLDN